MNGISHSLTNQILKMMKSVLETWKKSIESSSDTFNTLLMVCVRGPGAINPLDISVCCDYSCGVWHWIERERTRENKHWFESSNTWHICTSNVFRFENVTSHLPHLYCAVFDCDNALSLSRHSEKAMYRIPLHLGQVSVMKFIHCLWFSPKNLLEHKLNIVLDVLTKRWIAKRRPSIVALHDDAFNHDVSWVASLYKHIRVVYSFANASIPFLTLIALGQKTRKQRHLPPTLPSDRNACVCI